MSFSRTEKLMMQRCVDLARLGKGHVSPNPMVGCVLSEADEILSEGYHEAFGSHHAEVNTLNKINSERILHRSKLHVSLEPCCHSGKTPPCTDRIKQEKIKQVNVAMVDPFPSVSGNGITILEQSGIKVKSKVLEDKARIQNRSFVHCVKFKRPYVILKWAESADGYLGKNKEQVWLSNPYSKRLVHKWRSEADAIMVGTNTILIDDPELTNRYWYGKSPTRIIIDRNSKLPSTAKIFNYAASTIYFSKQNRSDIDCHQEIITEDRDYLNELMVKIFKQDLAVLFVEGGAKLLQSLINHGLWNEIRVIKTDKWLEKGIKAPRLAFDPVQVFSLKEDEIHIFHNQDKLD